MPRAVVAVDLGTERRVGEVRLHLHLPAAEKDTVCFARATLSQATGGEGQLVGEAIADSPFPLTGATWLSLKGHGARGRYLRVAFSGSVRGEITLDGLRVFPTAAQGRDLVGTTDGIGATGALTDGVFAVAMTAFAAGLAWSAAQADPAAPGIPGGGLPGQSSIPGISK